MSAHEIYERDASGSPTRVGLIGCGAIGRPIARALRDGLITGCDLSGILTRSQRRDDMAAVTVHSIDDLVHRSDLVVEAAGHTALADFGPAVIESGTDLLVLSVGALADDQLFDRVSQENGGRLLISTGAVGGLDILAAAMLAAPLSLVSLTSRKASRVLVRPWMRAELQHALSAQNGETEAFNGPARRAVELFPESANIAATLALATVGFDRLQVRMVGVSDGTQVEHRVNAVGSAGSYEFVFRNRPSESNPRTSAITPFSVMRALCRLRARTIVGF
jgi:aspartate dehydrogenase